MRLKDNAIVVVGYGNFQAIRVSQSLVVWICFIACCYILEGFNSTDILRLRLRLRLNKVFGLLT